MIYPLLGIIAGILVGFMIPDINISPAYSQLLACLDTVFGGARAILEKKFDLKMFLVGFFSNAALAALFVYVGARLGIDLYFVALITFGMRIFQNTAAIRRLLLFPGKAASQN